MTCVYYYLSMILLRLYRLEEHITLYNARAVYY